MPGILGVVTTNHEEALDNCLHGMITPMKRREWFKVEKSILPGAGIASVSLINEKTIAYRDSILLTYEGEIVDREQLRAKLLASGERGAHHYCLSEILLALYLNFGAQALCGLNGIYVIVVWEGEQRKLTLINDRYGNGKLFYWITNGMIMFASEMKAITWHPMFNHKISEIGLSYFFSSGGVLDEYTLFENLKVLPQACLATYHGGRLSIQEYWDYIFYEPGSRECSEKEYIAELYYRTKGAVCKWVEEKACLFLTGGLDSRTIAGLITQGRRNANLLTSTIGMEHSKDVHFAKEISNNLGIHHHTIPITPYYLDEYAKEFIWVTEGIDTTLGCWISAAWKFLLDQQICYSLTGLNGELLSGKHWVHFTFDGINEDQFIQSYCEREGVYLSEKILKPSVYKSIAGVTFKSVERCFKSAASQNLLNKYDKLWMHQIIRMSGLGPYVLGDYSRVFEPFFDNDLVDFVLRIPPELRKGGNLSKKMLSKYVPKVARASYRHPGQSLKSMTLRENNTLPRVYFGAKRRIQHKYFPSKKDPKRENLVGGFPFDKWLRKEMNSYVMSVLNQKEYLEDVLDMQVVDQIIEAHMSGKRNEYWSIGLLLTFSLWRQQFCG
jgi:asparagine synthase (glutamine-hydrolysing)